MDIEKIVMKLRRDLGESGENTEADKLVAAFEVPGKLEHSLLNPDIAREKIAEEIILARRYCVAAVCVAPYYVSEAAALLRGSTLKVCAAVGFPHGCIGAEAKRLEVKNCIENGADEVDISLNILAIKSGEIQRAREELEQIADIAQGKLLVKAVFEHSVYTEQEKIDVLEMIKSVAVPYVKIQNVLGGKGAEVSDIQFAKEHLGEGIKVKIDGGVKTLKKAVQLISAGADRIGLTATIAIAKEALT